ncbi:MAG TPA: HAD family hydrolase [Chitinophagaceae bacterium]|jgi:D,D-heptose 1,7-bisphosphate phosphatase
MNRAVFLDKDGTLIKNVSYNVDPAFIEFEPYAFEALQILHNHEFIFVIITNQPGIAFAFFTEDDLKKAGEYIGEKLRQQGININGFYYCPHHKSGRLGAYAIDCNCRKPAPGLLFKAASDMDIDLSRSWMIGDILNDVEAGNKAGCKTILINNGNETEWLLNKSRTPDYIVKDLKEAAEIIIKTGN